MACLWWMLTVFAQRSVSLPSNQSEVGLRALDEPYPSTHVYAETIRLPAPFWWPYGSLRGFADFHSLGESAQIAGEVTCMLKRYDVSSVTRCYAITQAGYVWLEPVELVRGFVCSSLGCTVAVPGYSARYLLSHPASETIEHLLRVLGPKLAGIPYATTARLEPTKVHMGRSNATRSVVFRPLFLGLSVSIKKIYKFEREVRSKLHRFDLFLPLLSPTAALDGVVGILP